MIPVLLKDIDPNSVLQEYVHKYQLFRFIFEKDIVLPKKYHTPHPEHCITFYVRDAQRFSYLNSETIVTYPRCVIIGMSNIPIIRYAGYDFLAIKVILKPQALFRLTGIPSQKLTNTFIDGEAVWGKELQVICEQLNSIDDLDEMLRIVERFLSSLVKKNVKYHTQ